jgi:hypothetical protein
MAVYSVRGLSVATAASADQAVANLWNPDSTKRLTVLELGLSKTGAGTAADSLYVARTTTRGTQVVTATPDGDNTWLNDGETPPSGAVLDTDWSAEPTKQSPGLFGWAASAVAGSGFVWPTPRGIIVNPGTGLCIVSRAATAWPVSEAYFVWEE